MDKNWGSNETYGLNSIDVETLRNRYYEGCALQELAADYRLSVMQIERVIDGHILPYAGGPLRSLPLQGCNPKFQESTRNRQRFVRGVIKRAKEFLSHEEFVVFANFNGLSAKDASHYANNSEDLNERLSQERYRSVLGRHAAGASIEEAVIAHSQRARKTPARAGSSGTG
jgi:hypothetical protein